MAHMEMKERPLRFAILTVSDTRTKDTDKGGNKIEELLLLASHEVIARAIVKDDRDAIEETVKNWLGEATVDVIITTGGTGIARRDVTCEALGPIFDKEIEGFGELFRYLSYTEDIGTRAMASRALAGTAKDKLIFSLPGSVGAVSLGMKRLILPEVCHLYYELQK